MEVFYKNYFNNSILVMSTIWWEVKVKMDNRNKLRIENRVLEVAQYIIDTKATIRVTAKVFGVSKSTIYKDIAERILKLNPKIAKDVEKVLLYNKSERHIRGGAATKRKYFYGENLRTS